MPKLIVIRGPSGSGKTTVAKRLQSGLTNPSLLLCEDEIRFKFSNWKQPDHKACKELALVSILSGLESGFDVIYEGISNVETYDQYFQKVFAEHPQDNHFFYLDVSFPETVRRHDTRPQKTDFTAAEMKRWRAYASPTGYTGEIIIREESSLEQTVHRIMKVVKRVNYDQTSISSVI